MKNVLILTFVLMGLSSLSHASVPTNVNEKVIHTFNKVFKNAQNVVWASKEKYNEASFDMGSVKTKAIINNDGHLIQTIRYYKEANLPSNILYSVRKKYNNEEIWGVTETSSENGVNYYITLKSEKSWYNIHANQNGSITLESKYNRADK